MSMTVEQIATLLSKDKRTSFTLLTRLIKNIVKSHLQLSNLTGFPTNISETIKEGAVYDFIVVGSGSAGSIIASRLAENPHWKILVIETGNYAPSDSQIPFMHRSLQGNEEDWSYVSNSSENFFNSGLIKFPSGKMLGGSGSMERMHYSKGSKEDYRCFEALDDPNWTYESILNTYRKIENKERINLIQTNPHQLMSEVIFKAAQELNLKTHDKKQEMGYFHCLNNIKEGERCSPLRAYLKEKKQGKANISICLDSNVDKLMVDKSTKIVTGVEIFNEQRKLEINAQKEVILCAGAIKSPLILINSGIGPKQHLNDLKINSIVNLPVGENLQDHPFFAGFVVLLNKNSCQEYRLNMDDAAYDYFKHRKGFLGTVFFSNMVGLISTKQEHMQCPPNARILHNLYLKNSYVLIQFLLNLNANSRVTSQIINENQKNHLLHFLPSLCKPKSRGKILSTSTEILSPKIVTNYFSDENGEDLQTMYDSIQFLHKFVKSEAFKPHFNRIMGFDWSKSLPDKKSSEEHYWKAFIKEFSSTLSDAVGTCKMGKEEDDTAVVTPKFNVKSLINLRVVDASVIPEIPCSGTHAMTMMVAEKAAEIIYTEHNKFRENKLF